MSHKTINIHADTYTRLQAIATPLRGSELGTPDKVISHLLDHYENEHPPPAPSRAVCNCDPANPDDLGNCRNCGRPTRQPATSMSGGNR